MARIHELLEEVKDPSLRRRLSEEVANLTRNKKFGLVFEDHEVERTLLYGVNIRAGMPAVKKAGKINEVWDVLKVEDGQAMCRRSIVCFNQSVPQSAVRCIFDVINRL